MASVEPMDVSKDVPAAEKVEDCVVFELKTVGESIKVPRQIAMLSMFIKDLKATDMDNSDNYQIEKGTVADVELFIAFGKQLLKDEVKEKQDMTDAKATFATLKSEREILQKLIGDAKDYYNNDGVILEKLDLARLTSFAIFVNYVDCDRMLLAVCKEILRHMDGMTPDEMREKFHIENDLTTAEIAQLVAENEWVAVQP